MKLYELCNEIEQIINAVDENGEMTLFSSNELADLNKTVEEKAIAVAAYIKNLEAEEEAIKGAILEMTRRKASLSNKSERLTDYLQSNLERAGILEIKSSPYFKIKLKKCPPSVDILNEEMIPKEYWVEKTSLNLDKIAIKNDIGAGFEIPGVQLINKTKLEIK